MINDDELTFDDAIKLQHQRIPNWWTWTFLLSLFLAVCYLTFYHVGAEGRDTISAFQAREAALTFRQIGEFSPQMPQDKASLAMFANQEKWLNYGASIFKMKCQSCHAAGGAGLIGPNLTDHRWKNIAKVEDIITILNNGAGNGAMPAWKEQLDPREIIIVAAYVATLMDTNPPNPKGPDGANTIDHWDLP